MNKILISTCLLGYKTQWDEDCKDFPELEQLVKSGRAIFVCPEQLGGLPTPRPATEIEPKKTAKDVLEGNAKILTKDGKDFTEQFVKGAQNTLDMCKKFGVTVAILKSKSPSCGSAKIYDGTFTGNKIDGHGVTAKLLMQNGIKVYDEETFPKELLTAS